MHTYLELLLLCLKYIVERPTPFNLLTSFKTQLEPHYLNTSVLQASVKEFNFECLSELIESAQMVLTHEYTWE